jgi:hypothetical protein
MLGVWAIFLVIVTIRFFRPEWMANISFAKLAIFAIGIHLLYGLFVTWGQHHVWAYGTDVTKALLSLPLPKQVPIYEWIRPLFTRNGGYFAFYAWSHYWLDITLTLVLSGVLWQIFKVWASRRGNFLDDGPDLLLVLMLVAGSISFRGIILLLALGFAAALLSFGYAYYKKERVVLIEPAFIVATYLTLALARTLLVHVL